MVIEGKKASIICILKILEKYTDPDHKITRQKVLDLLYDDYGILMDRKVISTTLDLLIELGYDIDIKSPDGVCLNKRLFTPVEAKYLIDAIFSSKSLPGSAARALAEKVSSTQSSFDQKKYNYIHKSTEINRTLNDEFYENLKLIEIAIKNKKKISFRYIDYKENGEEDFKCNGFLYTAYPYYIINNFGKYYLFAASYNKQRILKFRIELMKFVQVEDETSPDLKEIPGYSNFNITEYINTHFYLFDGDIVRAKFLIERKSMIKAVIDWFGNKVIFDNQDGKIYATVRACEKDIEYWLLQYCEDIKVIEPLSLVQSVKSKLERALSMYQDINANANNPKYNIYSSLEEAMFSIDKDSAMENTSEEDFLNNFKDYLSKYIGSSYDIDILENSLVVTNPNFTSEKYLVNVVYKTKEATNKDFMDLLSGIIDAQKVKQNYTQTYAIGFTKDKSYYSVNINNDLTDIFNYKVLKEMCDPVTIDGTRLAPYSPIKIKWYSPKDNKNCKFFINKS